MRNSLRALALVAAAAVLAAMHLNAQSPPISDDEQTGPEPVQTAPSIPSPTIKVNVDLVNIFFSVHAKKGGALIPNLSRSDFTIYEDGKQQKIEHFSRETDLPLTLGLLIDVSYSQNRLIDIEREAASQFFSTVIRHKDEAFLIAFGHDTTLLQDYTNSPRLLTAAMRNLQGDGPGVVGPGPIPNTGPVPQTGAPKGTLLYDAVYLASNEKLKGQPGRKALILITDGNDEGSYYKLADAIEAAQLADTIIYSIDYVDRGFYMQAGYIGAGGGGASDLKKMSQETGGRMFTVDRKHPLSEIFKEIEDEMRSQYSIGYESTNKKRDGTFRRIKIAAGNSDYRVQARSGYYATPNGAQ